MISKTEFRITKMDCPSEEQLIRMKLQNFDNIKLLEFDIPNRKLNVYHYGNAEHILKAWVKVMEADRFDLKRK